MAAQGLLSKDTKLSYKADGGTGFTVLPDLQEVPELGATANLIEVTTLADAAVRNINGLKDYGELAFKFLYDNSGADSSFRILKGLETDGEIAEFQVELPDGTTFTFEAGVSVLVDSVGVNAPITFTANLALNSDMVVGDPA